MEVVELQYGSKVLVVSNRKVPNKAKIDDYEYGEFSW